MFSLDSGHRYWLYDRPVNMRLGFNGLSGIVNNRMGLDVRSGDVFVFVNASRNRMKLLHREEGGLVLYSFRVDSPDSIAVVISHGDLLSMAKSAIDSPYVRRMKMLSSML